MILLLDSYLFLFWHTWLISSLVSIISINTIEAEKLKAFRYFPTRGSYPAWEDNHSCLLLRQQMSKMNTLVKSAEPDSTVTFQNNNNLNILVLPNHSVPSY